MKKSSGIVMVVVSILMALRTSSAQEMTTACPMVKCAPNCVRGEAPNGCPFCNCPPTCEGYRCDQGKECVLQQIQCFTTPCFPIPTCAEKQKTPKACPMLKCASNCVRGKGRNGCPTCYCPPTCEKFPCREGQACVLQRGRCARYPCFARPTCVPKQKLCPEEPPCYIRCMYGLKTDKRGCQLCECLKNPPV